MVLSLLWSCKLLSGSPSGIVLAKGGIEGTVKVWDLTSQYFTHNLTFYPQKVLIYGGFSRWGLLLEPDQLQMFVKLRVILPA